MVFEFRFEPQVRCLVVLALFKYAVYMRDQRHELEQVQGLGDRKQVVDLQAQSTRQLRQIGTCCRQATFLRSRREYPQCEG